MWIIILAGKGLIAYLGNMNLIKSYSKGQDLTFDLFRIDL